MAVDLNKMVNRKPRVLSTSQIEAINRQIFERVAWLVEDDACRLVRPDDVRAALSTALAEAFGPGGGVWLVWCDGEGNLKLNPIAYEAE